MFTAKHLLTVLDITKSKLLDYISKAEIMKSNSQEILREQLKGRILISVFFGTINKNIMFISKRNVKIRWKCNFDY